MSFFPCNNRAMKDTYNFNYAQQTNDMGENHTYRYVKYPFTKCTINGILQINNMRSYANLVGWTNYYTKSVNITITVNLLTKQVTATNTGNQAIADYIVAYGTTTTIGWNGNMRFYINSYSFS